jgi:hypothetical protein
MTEARYYLRGQTSIRDLEVDAMCTTSIHRLRDTGGFVYQGSPFSPIRTNGLYFHSQICTRMREAAKTLCTVYVAYERQYVLFEE